jgi:hypothetical protein
LESQNWKINSAQDVESRNSEHATTDQHLLYQRSGSDRSSERSIDMAFIGKWNNEAFAAITSLIGTVSGVLVG